MQFLLIPAAAYLALYAPGHYLLRGRRGEHAADGSHLLREILLSACCTSWVGFLLAELSVYSLFRLLAGLALVSLAAALRTWGSRPVAYGPPDLTGLAVLILSWLWVAPPLDTRITGSDSAAYLAAGTHLSRHGSLVFHDPTLPLLSVDLKRSLFHSVTRNPGSPPYLRLPGALLLRSLDTDEVLPAFHHLLAVWIAVFHGLDGPSAAQWVITLFAGLSVWAMVEFATAAGGYLAGCVFFVLLSFSAVQNWYSRFLMPEVAAQFFVWGGLCCLCFWSRKRCRADAVVAGLAFGIAGLMRIENVGFLLVALLAAFWLARDSVRPHGLVLIGCAVAVWAHAVAHLLLFRTHYVAIILSLLPEAVALFTHATLRQIVVLPACIVVLLLWARRAAPTVPRGAFFFALALAVCIAFWGDWRNGWPSLRLLTSYLGVPTLVVGGIGLGFYARRARGNGLTVYTLMLLVAAVFVQVMVAPHATPVPTWNVRRAATVLLPGLCFGAAFLCAAVAYRWRYSAAVLVCALALGGQAIPFLKLYRAPYYESGLRHIRAISALLPPHACLVFDSHLVGWGFDIGLWSERDLPAYLMSPHNAGRISQLVRTLAGTPVYWISNGYSPPPRMKGITLTPLALYEFSLSNPPPDLGAEPAAPINWDATVALYSLAVSEQHTGD